MMSNPLKECLLLCTASWYTKGSTQHHPTPLNSKTTTKMFWEILDVYQVPLQIALFKNVEMAKLLILLMAFLTDGPDSYNPVLVNRLHKHVLFQSVLTTLLVVVNRLLWIVGLLLHQWRLITRIQSITERNRLIFHGSTVLYLAMEN